MALGKPLNSSKCRIRYECQKDRAFCLRWYIKMQSVPSFLETNKVHDAHLSHGFINSMKRIWQSLCFRNALPFVPEWHRTELPSQVSVAVILIGYESAFFSHRCLSPFDLNWKAFLLKFECEKDNLLVLLVPFLSGLSQLWA